MKPAWVVLIGLLASAHLAVANPDAATVEQAKGHYTQGIAYIDAKLYDEAIAELDAGYKLVPLPEFLFNIGQAYRLKGDAEQAKQFYEQYLSVAPDGSLAGEARAHVEEMARAIAQQKAEEHEKAEQAAAANAETTKHTQEAAPHEAQARSYSDASQYDRAVAEFEAAYKIDPRPGLRFDIATAQRRAHDYGAATTEYQRYLSLEPAGDQAGAARFYLKDFTRYENEQRHKHHIGLGLMLGGVGGVLIGVALTAADVGGSFPYGILVIVYGLGAGIPGIVIYSQHPADPPDSPSPPSTVKTATLWRTTF